eukprot:1219440-Rhodomonas_salina.1
MLAQYQNLRSRRVGRERHALGQYRTLRSRRVGRQHPILGQYRVSRREYLLLVEDSTDHDGAGTRPRQSQYKQAEQYTAHEPSSTSRTASAAASRYSLDQRRCPYSLYPNAGYCV